MKRSTTLLYALCAVLLGGTTWLISRPAPQRPAPQPAPVRQPAPQPAPTLPTKTKSAAPEPAPVLTEEPCIPGLMPVDVYGNLERRGFKTEKRFGSIQNEWHCTAEHEGAELSATAFSAGASAVKVSSVSATSLYGDARTAAEFLGYVATLHYTDSDPAAAREWVNANITAAHAEMEIGGVRFMLSSAASAFTLRVAAREK